MSPEPLLLGTIPAATLVIALTELVKQAAGDALPARTYPVVALAWSLLLVGLGTLVADTTWYQSLVMALVVACAAMGLYAGARRLAPGGGQ